MSTSLLYHAYRIDGIQYKSTNYENGTVVFRGEMTKKYSACSECKSSHTHFKGFKDREFHMIPFGRKPCRLIATLHRLECSSCGHIGWPHLPFMQGKRRMVRSFIQYIFDLLEFGTISAVAQLTGLSWDTVKDLHKEKLATQYRSIPLDKIRAIGIDEFSISKGHEYMTIITDLDEGNIIHAVEGGDRESIEPFLKKLKEKAPLLEVVAMDMSRAYSSAVKDLLPHCKIVFDHFHVTALITKALDDIRKEQQAKCREKGISTLKGNRFLLLTNYDKLDPRKQDSLETLLGANEPLAIGYTMKEQFRLFWSKQSRQEGARFLVHWIIDAVETRIKPLVKAAKSLLDHAEGLLNYFVHRVSNGKTEGINNKIKTLKRQA